MYKRQIADCLKRYTSQRDKQKGEFFVHGFTLAMTAQNRFYRPISEQDTQAGYVDIFLCPLLDIYSDMKHSYIVELKYAKYKDPESRVEELRLEGITQANRYAETETVKNAASVLNVMSQQSIQLSPDVNVASVLQRVSGVTMERDASGEASYAILRGMDKRYNYTLVNGVKIPSPDDKNRYVPLNIFPSDLMDLSLIHI